MRTVIIIDDEKLVRLGLKAVINWEEQGYEVTGVYKNGAEAWEAIQQRCPDIVLTDIRMPKMDGMELIALLKKYYPAVNVIILSSHEDYEYTRKAIQLNVKDYILKHKLEPEDLLRVLNHMKFPEASNHTNGSPLLKEEKQKLLLWSKDPDHWIWSDHANLWAEIPNIARTYFNEETNACFSWISIRIVSDYKTDLRQNNKALESLLDGIFFKYDACFLGDDEDTYSGLLLMPEQSYYYTQNVGKMIEEMCSVAKNMLNRVLYVGLSSAFSAPTHLIKARKEAEEALSRYFFHGAGIYGFDKLPETRPFTKEEWIFINREAKQLLWNEQFERLNQWIENMSERMIAEINVQDAKRFCNLIIQRLVDYLLERYQSDFVSKIIKSDELKDRYLQLHLITTYEEWLQVLKAFLVTGQSTIKELKGQKDWIVKTIEYIESNYHRSSLRLGEVARHVHFSETYFSQRFHEETGSSFMYYLMRYRIERAQELLLADQNSTEEISGQVGYDNPNYFIKVFKKITGMTITEFKGKK